jgi:hypothetical protein
MYQKCEFINAQKTLICSEFTSSFKTRKMLNLYFKEKRRDKEADF